MKSLTLLIILTLTSAAYAVPFASVHKDVYGFQGGGLGDIYHPYSHKLSSSHRSTSNLYGRAKGRGTLKIRSGISNRIYGPRNLTFRGNVFSNRGHYRGLPSSWRAKKQKDVSSEYVPVNPHEFTFNDEIRAQPNFRSQEFERF